MQNKPLIAENIFFLNEKRDHDCALAKTWPCNRRDLVTLNDTILKTRHIALRA